MKMIMVYGIDPTNDYLVKYMRIRISKDSTKCEIYQDYSSFDFLAPEKLEEDVISHYNKDVSFFKIL